MPETTVVGLAFIVVSWLLALSYHAGKIAGRVDTHDRWRSEHLVEHEIEDREHREDLKQIFEKIDNLWGRNFGSNEDQ